MKITYQPSNWFWIVAGSTADVYSSATVGYVPVTDAAYLAWVAGGRHPTRIASEQELIDALAAIGQAIPAGKTASDAQKTTLVNALDKTIFKVLFNHENRIRALEAKPAISVAQFRAALRLII